MGHLVQPLTNPPQAQFPQGGTVTVGNGRIPKELEQQRGMSAVEQLDGATGARRIRLVAAELSLQCVNRSIRLSPRGPREMRRTVGQNADALERHRGRRIAINPGRGEHAPHLIG